MSIDKIIVNCERHGESGAVRAETVRVLLVEDNPLDVEAIRVMLRLCPRTRFKVDSVVSPAECLEALKGNSFDLILLDHNLPGVDGLSFLQSFNHDGGLPPVIILTEQVDERVAEEAMRCGAYDCLPKDRISPQGLARSIHQALEKLLLKEQLEDGRRPAGRLRSVAGKEVRPVEENVGPVNGPKKRTGAALKTVDPVPLRRACEP